MDRQTTDSLAQFCASQHTDFAAADWQVWSDIDEDAVALAAKYLSMTSWYGHGEELEEIAMKNHFSEKGSGLHRESQAISFDLPYFSVKVRVSVVRRQLEPEPGRDRWAGGRDVSRGAVPETGLAGRLTVRQTEGTPS